MMGVIISAEMYVKYIWERYEKYLREIWLKFVGRTEEI